MSKKVFYNEDARARVLGGAKILYDAVKTTLGPKGRNVVIGKQYGNPTVTKDGVTVAKSVELANVDDETLGYKVGADLIKSAANKLNDIGDGTTTVTVLTYHILKEANKLIAAGYSPILIRKGLEKAATEAIKNLDSLSETIQDDKAKITQVATISASDKEIGELIADVISKVGKDGVVTVEAGQGLQLKSEITKGYTLDRGLISPYLATDTTRLEAAYSNPSIVITDRKISSITEILPLLEKLAAAGRKELLLIAEDVDGEALASLILNKLKGQFNTVAIKAPFYGEQRKSVLEDIAILTGATVITSDTGLTFENADLTVVGFAEKVIVSKDETTIINGKGDVGLIEERLNAITAQAENTSTPYEKELLISRNAALSGKVAVIKVGGATETEIEEKKFRVDDAVAATKAALSEGIVAGGGVTLIDLAKKISDLSDEESSVNAGIQLLKNSFEQPFKTLLRNSGISPDQWLAQIKDSQTNGLGINVANDVVELSDMKQSGIIDPTKVTKEVITNAVSLAGTAITMGALVVDVPEETPQNNMNMGMM